MKNTNKKSEKNNNKLNNNNNNNEKKNIIVVGPNEKFVLPKGHKYYNETDLLSNETKKKELYALCEKGTTIKEISENFGLVYKKSKFNFEDKPTNDAAMLCINGKCYNLHQLYKEIEPNYKDLWVEHTEKGQRLSTLAALLRDIRKGVDLLKEKNEDLDFCTKIEKLWVEGQKIEEKRKEEREAQRQKEEKEAAQSKAETSEAIKATAKAVKGDKAKAKALAAAAEEQTAEEIERGRKINALIRAGKIAEAQKLIEASITK